LALQSCRCTNNNSDDHRIYITFGDLSIDNKVEVKAFRQPDSTYLASIIKKEGMPESEIGAQIESIVEQV
jgi:hypothetical protein